jgi:hypothetical protein
VAQCNATVSDKVFHVTYNPLASCMRWSICPVVLSDVEVPLKSIQ